VQDGADPDDLPPALAPYYIHTPMASDLKDSIATALINRGADEQIVTNWFTNHPSATPTQLHDAFGQLVTISVERAG